MAGIVVGPDPENPPGIMPEIPPEIMPPEHQLDPHGLMLDRLRRLWDLIRHVGGIDAGGLGGTR